MFCENFWFQIKSVKTGSVSWSIATALSYFYLVRRLFVTYFVHVVITHCSSEPLKLLHVGLVAVECCKQTSMQHVHESVTVIFRDSLIFFVRSLDLVAGETRLYVSHLYLLTASAVVMCSSCLCCRVVVVCGCCAL